MTFLPAVLLEYNVLVWACVFMQSKKCAVHSWELFLIAKKREQCACVRALQVRVGR